MGEAKRRKSLSSNSQPQESLDKPLEDLAAQLNTPLGRAIILLLQSVPVPFPNPIEPKHRATFQEFQSEFTVELLWVLKEWNRTWSRNEYPFNTQLFRALESRGWRLFQMLNMASKCKEFDPSFSHPLMHWMFAMAEEKVCVLERWFDKGTDRKICIKNNTITHDLLAAWENPYKSETNPSEPMEGCAWRYMLIESAIAIGNAQLQENEKKQGESHLFWLQAWKPHLDSIRKMNGDLRTGVGEIKFGSYEIRGDSIHHLLGGRKTEVIYAPPRKNISGRGRKPKENPNNLYAASDTALLNQLLTGV